MFHSDASNEKLDWCLIDHTNFFLSHHHFCLLHFSKESYTCVKDTFRSFLALMLLHSSCCFLALNPFTVTGPCYLLRGVLGRRPLLRLIQSGVEVQTLHLYLCRERFLRSSQVMQVQICAMCTSLYYVRSLYYLLTTPMYPYPEYCTNWLRSWLRLGNMTKISHDDTWRHFTHT